MQRKHELQCDCVFRILFCLMMLSRTQCHPLQLIFEGQCHYQVPPCYSKMHVTFFSLQKRKGSLLIIHKIRMLLPQSLQAESSPIFCPEFGCFHSSELIVMPLTHPQTVTMLRGIG